MTTTAVLSAAALFERTKALEDRGREYAGLMNAATAGLVEVIADALTDDAWRGYGIHTPEQWAALHFGLTGPRARRLVAAARDLASLPAVREVFASGAVSEDLVAVIERAGVLPKNDAQVAELSCHTTVHQLARALSTLPERKKKPTKDTDKDKDEPPDDVNPDPEPEAGPQQRVGFGPREDGMWALRATLDAAAGAVVDKALTAARDKLFRAKHADDADPALRNDISWHDALLHLCKVGLDALDPATKSGGNRMPTERYLVNIHLDATDPDVATLNLGPALPKPVREELTCEALVRTWIRDQRGNVNLGRTQRVVGDQLRTVVEWRDGGTCRVPGCGACKWLHIHHIWHWDKGGPTDTWNLVALCPAHHRAVHRGDLIIRGDADSELTFLTRDGRVLRHIPPQPIRKPLRDAAFDLGLPQPQWHNRTGERADWRWLAWNDWAGDPPPHVNQN